MHGQSSNIAAPCSAAKASQGTRGRLGWQRKASTPGDVNFIVGGMGLLRGRAVGEKCH